MSENKLKCFFSLVSGEIYYIEEDEVKNIDKAQIPLLKKPSTSCKRCYGRFHIGQHAKFVENKWHKDYYIPCPKCAPSCVDHDSMKELSVESARTTSEKADDSFTDALNK